MPAPVTSSLNFQQFVSFAESATSGRAILQSQTAKDGTLSITPRTKGDFIGNLRRSESIRSENNSIRTAFRDSVVAMLGVGSYQQLPESVQKALNLDDYEKGKPLTARRILTVKAAVDKHINTLAKTLEKTFLSSDFSDFDLKVDDTVKARIGTALQACKGDTDAITLIRSNLFHTLYDSRPFEEPRLLSEDAVKARVATITRNLDALRQATGGDTRLFNMAKPFLWTADKTVFTPQDLTSMMSVVKSLDLSALRNLTPKSSAQDILKASMAFKDLSYTALSRLSISPYTKDHGHILACMLFAKGLPTSVPLRYMQAALEKGPAQNLVKYLQDTYSNPFFSVGDEDRAVKLQLDLLEELKGFIDRCCGGPSAQEKPIEPAKKSLAPDEARTIMELSRQYLEDGPIWEEF